MRSRFIWVTIWTSQPDDLVPQPDDGFLCPIYAQCRIRSWFLYNLELWYKHSDEATNHTGDVNIEVIQ